MSAFVFAATAGLCLTIFSGSAQADADACASAYSRGQEERLAGRLFSARSAFQVCAASPCPSAIANDCARWVAEVEQDLPTIVVRLTDVRGEPIRDVRVSADGTEIPSAQLGRPIIVEAGPHALRFEAAGFQPLSLEASLRPSDRELPVVATLHALDEPPAQPSAAGQRSLALPLTLAAVGAVALGTSLYFGLSAHSQYEDLKASCAPNCSQAQADSVSNKALISDVALGAAAVSLGAGAWFYFSAPGRRPLAVLNFAPRADGAALRLRIAF